jgi:hypothetical protein
MLKRRMNRSLSVRVKLGAIVAFCGLLAALAGGAAYAELVQVGPLVLQADGGFIPRKLPRNRYVPIRFEGHVRISSTNSEPVPPLRQIKLNFDRDGLITTKGLAVCSPTQIEASTPQAARQACKAAIIGTGHVHVAVSVPGGGTVNVESPLTLFNGPRQEGNLTVLAHAQTTFPKLETFVVVVPVERLHGAYSYRATVNLPEIAEGHGALTYVDGKIGKRWRSGGKERSYTSARCSDGILETQGRLVFAEGTIISGTIFKPCSALG